MQNMSIGGCNMKNKNRNNSSDNWYYDQKLARSGSSYRTCWYCFIAMIVLLFLSALFTSCKSIQYVPVETVRTEYKHTVDTIKQTDSIFSEKETIIREADSALVADLGLKLKANEKAILILKKELERQVNNKSEHHVDTVIKTDSIQVPYPVEKQLTKWQKMKMKAGGVSLIACLLIVIGIVVGLIFRAYKRT